MATVAALFDRYENADQALHQLNDLGYGEDQISVVASEEAVAKKITGDQGDAAEGITSGAVIGGLTGLLFGVGVLIVPGVGPVLSAGVLAGILGSATAAGAGVGAAIGGLRGALAEMDVPDAEAETYAEGVRKGNILVTVVAETEEDIANVRQVFQANEAARLNTRRSIFERGEGGEYMERTIHQENERREG